MSPTIQGESNVLKANSHYYAIPWFIPGTVTVVPYGYKGAWLSEGPLIIHDDTNINDIEFNPQDESILATACQNGEVGIWKIPDGGLTENLNKTLRTLQTGEKRVLSVDFHPLTSNVLLSFDAAKKIRFWDIETGNEFFSLLDVHKSLPTNLSWNLDGSLCSTSCKDKMLRIFDPRANKCIAETADHQGTKGGRVAWLKKKNLIFTCGFAKGSDRQLALYDPRKLDQRLALQSIDTSSSSLMPFVDEDNSVLWLAGKGDGNIRYYEIADEEPYVFYLNEFKSKDPQSGMALLPKSVCDVMRCEISRLAKLTPQGQIIPIRFEVPRQDNHFFQEDLFPDTFDNRPTMTPKEWINGANNGPTFKSMNPEKK